VPADPETIQTKAARIRLLLFDVDGVLTDGKILVHPDGSESKRFDIRDGTALVWAHRAGLMTGLISGRVSACTTHRAAQLGIPIVHQSALAKAETYEQIVREHHFRDEEVAFMGDDLLDLPVLARVGLSAAPADGAPAVRERVDWVSESRGGDGAVRELIELVLQAQHRWDEVVSAYVAEGQR